VGSLFALALPTSTIQVVAGLAFFGFAAWTLRGDTLGEAEQGRAARTGRWALVTIGTAFFLAELGDKTMLATVTPATTEEPIGTEGLGLV
jgi:putative Ca2+/H+ antiporter (TMEM165/GDT1 family)